MDRNQNKPNRTEVRRNELELRIPFTSQTELDQLHSPPEGRMPDSPLDVLVMAYLEDPERWDGMA